MIKPNELNYLINFKDFINYQNLIKNYNLLNDKLLLNDEYKLYKQNFFSRQLYAFFLMNKNTPWFLERYSKDFENERNNQKLISWNNKPNEFINELVNGNHDDVSFDKPSNQVNSNDNDDNNNSTDTNKSDNPLSHIITSITLPPPKNQVFIKTIPPDIGRVKLQSILKDIEGFHHLALSEPLPSKRYHRIGWIKFNDGVDIDHLLETKLNGLKIDDFTIYMQKSENSYTAKARIAPPLSNSAKRLKSDLNNAQNLLQFLDNKYNELFNLNDENKINGLKSINERVNHLNINDEIERTKKELDFIILYLRNSYNTCYYSSSINDHPEELIRKSPIYYRSSLSDVSTHQFDENLNSDGTVKKKYADENWARNLDEKLAMLIDDTIKPSQFGGLNYDDEVSIITSTLIKKEEESKYRCLECTKLFRAPSFIEKHILNKHSNLIDLKKLNDIETFNSYVMDPQRILPTPNTPASVNGKLTHDPSIINSGPSSSSTKRSFDDWNNNGSNRDDINKKRYKRNTDSHYNNNSNNNDDYSNNLNAKIDLQPPPGAKIDPRSHATNTYEDLDVVGGGDDVELQY